MPGPTSGSITLVPNQQFQTIGWVYGGDLFTGAVNFGGNVLFTLENATQPVWSNGQSAPGTFTTGQVAVAIGTTSLRYGLTGTVVMSEGTFTLSTPGGTAHRMQGGAIGALSGQMARVQSNQHRGRFANANQAARGAASAVWTSVQAARRPPRIGRS